MGMGVTIIIDSSSIDVLKGCLEDRMANLMADHLREKDALSLRNIRHEIDVIESILAEIERSDE